MRNAGILVAVAAVCLLGCEEAQLPGQTVSVERFTDLTPNLAAKQRTRELQAAIVATLSSSSDFIVKQAQEIGAAQTTGPNYLVTGSVLRGFAGYRLTVELHEVQQSGPFWAQVYEIEDDGWSSLAARVATDILAAAQATAPTGGRRIGLPLTLPPKMQRTVDEQGSWRRTHSTKSVEEGFGIERE